MIYYLVFVVSATMLQIGCGNKKVIFNLKQQSLTFNLRRILIVLAVLIPSVFAGLRDVSVGTDVSIYIQQTFQMACRASSIQELVSASVLQGIEPGYLTLAYLSSRISTDIHCFFFITALLIYSLLVAVIYEAQIKVKPGIAWFCYCCLCFGDSLNIVRQVIALAIVLFSYRYVKREKMIPYFFAVLIASLFHQSAMVAIVFPVFYQLLKKANRWFHFTWIVIGTIIGLIFYNQLLTFAISIGLFSSKFSHYLSTASYRILLIPTITRLIPLGVIVLFWQRMKNDLEVRFFLLVMILDILLYNITTLSTYAGRVSYYMGYFRILAYPMFCKLLDGKKNQMIISAVMCVFVAIIFYYEVIIHNTNEIYPYIPSLFGSR